MDIDLSSISNLSRLRPSNEDKVCALEDSFKTSGQLQPIIVKRTADGYRLIAGLHRLLAARKLGWTTIRAEITDFETEDDLRLAEIDENLIRAELSPAQVASFTAKRKEIYERKYPESTKAAKNIAKGKGAKSQVESLPSFVDDTAAKTGKSAQDVSRNVARGKVPNVEKLAATPLDKGTVLDGLAAINAPAQAKREKAGQSNDPPPKPHRLKPQS